MNRILILSGVVLILICTTFSASGQTSRVWTSKSGATIEDVFVKTANDSVTLEKSDGTMIQISRAGLAPQDNEYLRSLANIGAKKEVKGKLQSGVVKLLGNDLVLSCTYSISTTLDRIKSPIVFTRTLVEKDDTTRMLIKGMPVSQARFGGLVADHVKPDVLSTRKAEVNASTIQIGSFRTEKIKGYVSSPVVGVIQIPSRSNIILWRIELWCDGVLLDAVTDATEPKLKSLSISEDWYK